jgi:NADPH:quinone reductase-like Zn-dependent oxidoreductase
MRAYASDKFGTVGDLRIMDVPKPVPTATELLIEVRAAAVNPADLKVLEHRDGGSFLHASKFPLILGYDFSGVVVEAPGGSHAVGDEVFGFLPYARGTKNGTYAEFVAVGATTVGKKPKAISHEAAAAAATSAATALQGLRKGRIASGHAVLVNGASGGVGSYAVQIAKCLGATVTATCSAAKTAFVKAQGADKMIDYKTTPLGALEERFDIVFDVASSSGFGTCAKLLKPGGGYVALLPSPSLFFGMARAVFSSKRCGFIVVKPVAADFEELAAWFAEGKLKPLVDASYPLAELPVALERQRAGDIRGKLAITIA